MAETIEQWYDMLEQTYNQLNNEITRLQIERETIQKSISTDESNEELDEESDEELNLKLQVLTKQINSIVPTVEKYKYYLDYRNKPTNVSEEF